MATLTNLSKHSGYSHGFEMESSSKNQINFKPPSAFNARINQELQRKFTSAFYQDHNEEEYVIQRAFNCNNFTYLRKLPDNLKHGDILHSRKQKVTKNVQNQTIIRSKDFQQKIVEKQLKINQKRKQQIGTLGYFTPFEYHQSNYQMPKIIDSLQRIQGEKKRKQISDLDFRPSGVQTKFKYQDPFKFVDKSKTIEQRTTNQNYLFPFHVPQDTYDVFHESELRRKIISDSMKIDGDFIPAKKEQVLTKVNKQKLGEIIDQIELFLRKYLKQIAFFIGVTKKDHIEVLFESKHKNDNKVTMMMSKICQHEVMCKYLLRRNISKWGVHHVEKGYIVYCILPSWVKNPVEQLKK